MKLIKKLNVKLWVLLQLSCDRLQVIKLLSTTGNVESAMVVLQRVKACSDGFNNAFRHSYRKAVFKPCNNS